MITPTRYQTQEPDLRWRAFQREVLAYVGAPAEKVLVDVRSPAEFSGEVISPPGMTETAQRAGHIPRAQNILWGQAVNEDGTLKSSEQLRQRDASKGFTPEKDV